MEVQDLHVSGAAGRSHAISDLEEGAFGLLGEDESLGQRSAPVPEHQSGVNVTDALHLHASGFLGSSQAGQGLSEHCHRSHAACRDCQHQGVHTVTCLANLTCFYDRVDLDQIIELAYPPLHLNCSGPLPGTPHHSGRRHQWRSSTLQQRDLARMSSSSSNFKADPLQATPGPGDSTPSCLSSDMGG